ncbi:DUF262 domain-containing protein [Antribacter sp. KLBMP9083]|uniref:DUF262 domain-containing protein n=1 Tax=Antribacter soli TaxID=2910976 RepID=A0AA41QEN6_9MICO|nr:DUF262 domain-containing protein [Antribacter soli]MCF4122074.1 DUF262 domain-containing protein [Antribacter soli]
MLDYASATSKSAAVARMYALADVTPEPLGRGSKEKRSAFEALGKSVGLDLSTVPSKHRCARAIAEVLGVEWDADCESNGDTITLVGMNRLVDAAALARLGGSTPSESTSLVERLLAVEIASSLKNQKEEVQMFEVPAEVAQNIADYLARLSEPGPEPEDFGSAPIPFAAAEVRFDDGSWRQRLREVQYWLYLSVSLDHETSPESFDAVLAEGLGLDAGTDRSTLFEALVQRLERALALRDEFWLTMAGDIEGSATLTTASTAWRDSWSSEADDETEPSTGPINAEADMWPIVSFVGYASDGDLNLSPSYQRADVWPTADAQKLIESILRGIPLPSVIILERKRETGHGTEYEVVDGKQRLTSVLRFTGAHPRAIEVVKQKSHAWGIPEATLLNTFRTNYREFRKLWKQHDPSNLTSELERANQFPFALRSTDTPNNRNPLTGALEGLRGKYFYEVRNEYVALQGVERQVGYIFDAAHATYKIPVIVYKQVTPAQVHEVFSLYNKQGKKLNAEEIRNALYHRLALMRALLVTAGDSKAVEEVAPFLVGDWDDLASAGENLRNYEIGDIGYKRTKVLSWAAAALLLDGGDGVTRSTSAHIDGLLQRVADKTDKVEDPLRDPERVRQAMLLLDHGLDAHATPDDVWSKTFRSGKGTGSGKWQELSLVASLVALSAAAAVLGDDLIDTFEEVAPEVRRLSEKWGRPHRNQSREQWQWIGFVVGEILSLLGVNPGDAHEALEKQFGYSGLGALVEHAVPPIGYNRA